MRPEVVLAAGVTMVRNVIAVLVLVVISLFGASVYLSPGSDTRPQDDALHYAASAYNIAKYGVYSRSRVDDVERVEPKYRREPLYPALLAAVLVLDGEPESYDIDCLLYEKGSCRDERRALLRVNELLVFALLLLIGLSGRAITGNWLVGIGAALGVAVGNFYAPLSIQWALYPEPLAALLLLLHSTALYLCRARSRAVLWWCLVSGVSLGLLVLTKAIFQYWLLLLAAAALIELIAVWFRAGRKGGRRAGLVLVVCCAALIAGAWATRNYIQVGHFAISERAGNILLLRTMFAQISAREYRAALCSWGPDQLDAVKDVLCANLPKESFSRIDGGPDQSGSFKGKRNLLLEEYEQFERQRIPKEKEKIKDGLRGYLSSWPKQVALTALFAYRGAWMETRPLAMGAEESRSLARRGLAGLKRLVDSFSIVLVPGFLVLVLLCLMRRETRLLWFCLPALYAYGIHAVATHYLPRYGLPAVPVYALSVMVLLLLAARALRPRTSASPRQHSSTMSR